jgi:hypothetical protein
MRFEFRDTNEIKFIDGLYDFFEMLFGNGVMYAGVFGLGQLIGLQLILPNCAPTIGPIIKLLIKLLYLLLIILKLLSDPATLLLHLSKALLLPQLNRVITKGRSLSNIGKLSNLGLD